MNQEHLLEREMPLSLRIASLGMAFVLLLGRHMCQLIVATDILGASTMLQRHSPCCYIITLRYVFLQRYMEVSSLSFYIHIYYILLMLYEYVCNMCEYM